MLSGLAKRVGVCQIWAWLSAQTHNFVQDLLSIRSVAYPSCSLRLPVRMNVYIGTELNPRPRSGEPMSVLESPDDREKYKTLATSFEVDRPSLLLALSTSTILYHFYLPSLAANADDRTSGDFRSSSQYLTSRQKTTPPCVSGMPTYSSVDTLA